MAPDSDLYSDKAVVNENFGRVSLSWEQVYSELPQMYSLEPLWHSIELLAAISWSIVLLKTDSSIEIGSCDYAIMAFLPK